MKKFVPLPPYLRDMRGKTGQQDYLRLYGLFVPELSIREKRFGFSVRINPKLSDRQVRKKVAEVINNLLNRKVPEHKKGQIFRSFKELLERTHWKKVRKVLSYKAGVIYDK